MLSKERKELLKLCGILIYNYSNETNNDSYNNIKSSRIKHREELIIIVDNQNKINWFEIIPIELVELILMYVYKKYSFSFKKINRVCKQFNNLYNVKNLMDNLRKNYLKIKTFNYRYHYYNYGYYNNIYDNNFYTGKKLINIISKEFFIEDKVCASCCKSSIKLKRCNRCKKTLFCDTKCQKEAWKYHKEFC